MALSKTIEAALNKQLNTELHAAYNYLAMAAHFDAISLGGFAAWMKVQAKEELEHAMKFYAFIEDANGKIALDAVAKPVGGYKTVTQVFEKALATEEANTASINKVYALAIKEEDYATQTMLHWFIKEQVEEEKSVGDILAMLKMAGEAPTALLQLNGRLAQRAAG